MKLLRKFTRLPMDEKQFFLKAVLCIGYFRIKLKTTSLQALFSQVNRQAEDLFKTPKTSGIPPLRMARLIQRANQFVPLSTCLAQSLAGKKLFAENGFRTTIHIGVNNDRETGFEAHAWLTMDDTVLLGDIPGLDQYSEFPSSSAGDQP